MNTTTVTAIIRNDSNQLLFVMGSGPPATQSATNDGEWVLPWGPITPHGDHDHEVYTPHEMDTMMSLADMLLTTLGAKIKSCQWVSTGKEGEEYEVILETTPDGERVMWY